MTEQQDRDPEGWWKDRQTDQRDRLETPTQIQSLVFDKGGGRDRQAEHRGLESSGSILCDTVVGGYMSFITRWFKPVECTTPGEGP